MRPVSRWTSSLEQHGGYVLLLAGSGLIALAAVLADKPAVAPLFALFGAACLILGCFYSRIEGSVEATKEGVRIVVREIERRGVPPEDVPEVLELALENYTPSSSRPRDVLRAAQTAATAAVDTARGHHQTLRAGFAAWLRDQGWAVEIEPRFGSLRPDIIAHRPQETLVVEVKTSASAANVATAAEQLANYVRVAGDQWPGVRGAVVFPLHVSLGALSTALRDAAIATDAPIEIYGVDALGHVEQIGAWPLPG